MARLGHAEPSPELVVTTPDAEINLGDFEPFLDLGEETADDTREPLDGLEWDVDGSDFVPALLAGRSPGEYVPRVPGSIELRFDLADTYPRSCAGCGVEFTPRYPSAQTCSPACRLKRGARERRQLAPRICVECGTEFVPTQPATKSCSRECAGKRNATQLTHRRRQAPIKCPCCGVKFAPLLAGERLQKYCSRTCTNRAKSGTTLSLPDSDVQTILSEIENGTTARALADRFGVSPCTIRRIVRSRRT